MAIPQREPFGELRRLARLFWDHPLSEADFERHAVWVAERVLDFGDLEDVQSLQRRYGRERFLELAAQAVCVSPRTQRLWTCILEQEGYPCTRKFSRPAHRR